MIDVLNEDLIDLKAACRLPPFRNPRTGKPAHVASIYRYINPGGKATDGSRVPLEVAKTPRGLLTSRQAIERFFQRLTNPGNGPAAPTPKDRARQIAAAEARLAAAGIK